MCRDYEGAQAPQTLPIQNCWEVKKMLNKMQIYNFQSHKNSALEFVPGTNVIIGESDSGKSAVLRALYWAIFNRPLGEGYTSEWGGNTKVILHTVEGNTIERSRTNDRNVYAVNDEHFEGFGSEVPEEITRSLAIDPANVQFQMDPPFLLASTPGEAAKLLNKAASIDDIDTAIANLKNAHAKVKNSLQTDEACIKQYKEQLTQYDNIPAIEEKLLQVEKQEKTYQHIHSRTQELKKLIDKIKIKQLSLVKMEHISQLLKKYEHVFEQCTSLQKKSYSFCRFKRILKRAKNVQANLRTKTHVGDCMRLLCDLQKEHKELTDSHKTSESLQELYRKIIGRQQTLKKENQRITELEEEFIKLAPETCPLCGSMMKGEKRNGK